MGEIEQEMEMRDTPTILLWLTLYSIKRMGEIEQEMGMRDTPTILLWLTLYKLKSHTYHSQDALKHFEWDES